MLARFDKDWHAKYEYDLDVAYWRKCWNIRSIIYHVLGAREDNDCQIPMTREDVLVIIAELKQINGKNWYDLPGDSIWSWTEFKDQHKNNIANLKKLARWMKKYPNMEVYFYDSW